VSTQDLKIREKRQKEGAKERYRSESGKVPSGDVGDLRLAVGVRGFVVVVLGGGLLGEDGAGFGAQLLLGHYKRLLNMLWAVLGYNGRGRRGGGVLQALD